MNVFQIFSAALAVVAATTACFPLSIVFAALACKIRFGQRPLPFEPEQFWTRSIFASLGLAGMTLVMAGLWLLLVKVLELPYGPVEVVLLLAYIPFAIWYVFWIFGLDDLLEAIGIFAIYVLLPGFPLVIVAWILKLWPRAQQLLH